MRSWQGRFFHILLSSNGNRYESFQSSSSPFEIHETDRIVHRCAIAEPIICGSVFHVYQVVCSLPLVNGIMSWWVFILTGFASAGHEAAVDWKGDVFIVSCFTQGVGGR